MICQVWLDTEPEGCEREASLIVRVNDEEPLLMCQAHYLSFTYSGTNYLKSAPLTSPREVLKELGLLWA